MIVMFKPRSTMFSISARNLKTRPVFRPRPKLTQHPAQTHLFQRSPNNTLPLCEDDCDYRWAVKQESRQHCADAAFVWRSKYRRGSDALRGSRAPRMNTNQPRRRTSTFLHPWVHVPIGTLSSKEKRKMLTKKKEDDLFRLAQQVRR